MFALSQLGAIVIVSVAIWWMLDEEEAYPIWPAVAIILVDVLVLAGAIGPGLPLSAKTGTELLIADCGALALFLGSMAIYEEEAELLAFAIAGLLVVGLLEWLLLAGTIWPQHHLIGAETPIFTAPPADAAAPIPAVTVTVAPTVTVTVTTPAPPSGQSASGGMATAIALAAAGGALLGGVGTFLTGLASHRRHY
jgi:hypothetical protein